MSDRESQVRRLQVGLIRSLTPPDALEDTLGRNPSDSDLLNMYGESSRPLAEALRDVLADLARGGEDD